MRFNLDVSLFTLFTVIYFRFGDIKASRADPRQKQGGQVRALPRQHPHLAAEGQPGRKLPHGDGGHRLPR